MQARPDPGRDEVLLQAPSAICVLRGSGLLIESCNPAWQRITGRSLADGSSLHGAFPELCGHRLMDALERAMASGEPFAVAEQQVELVRDGGGAADELYLSVHFLPLQPAGDGSPRLMLFCTDQTALVQARRQVGHDLRNPIAAIQNAVTALLHLPGSAAELLEGLALIDRNAGQLSHLVDDVLDPRRRLGPGHAGPPPATATPSRRVLLVDDDADVRSGLRSLLRSLGHEVQEAADAAQALELLRLSAPDVALVDVAMPGLDGHAFVREVRAREEGQHLFVVAVSGFGSLDEGERALEAGFDLFRVKPLPEAALLEVLADPRAARTGSGGAA